MALRWLDSFDHYDDGQIGQKYTTATNSPQIGAGRFTNGLFLNAQSSAMQAQIVLTAQTTWIVGMAIIFADVASPTSTIFLRLRDGASEQLDVRRAATSGNLQVTNNGFVLGTSTTSLQNSVWYYVELKTTINNSGTWELRLNGVTETSGSGDTSNTGSTTADRLCLSGNDRTSGTDDITIDDLYICDGTGGSGITDTFLGDIRVQALFPNGNGNSSVLVGSDGNSTDNYLLVDETTTVNDADYVESGTAGDKDTYTYGNLTPTTGTVYGVQPVLRAAKTDAGTRSLVSVARLSGTETDGSVKTLSTSVAYYPDIREAKPGGGVWTVTDVNSAEFGVKINA